MKNRERYSQGRDYSDKSGGKNRGYDQDQQRDDIDDVARRNNELKRGGNFEDDRDFDRNYSRYQTPREYEGQNYRSGGSDRSEGRDRAADYNRDYASSGGRDDRSHEYGNQSNREYGSGYHGGRHGSSGNQDRGHNMGYGEHDRDERDWMSRAGDEVRSWFGDEEAAARRNQDDHRGKGPRNYRRSDARIEEDVSDRLTDNLMVDASNISVSVSDGEVTLDGTVDSKIAKRCAEDCCDSVSSVKHVQNNLRISNNSGNRWDRTEESSSTNIAQKSGKKPPHDELVD